MKVDISSPAHKVDPFPLYARLRREAPVCRVTLSGGQEAWLVTRYAEVAAVLADRRLVKNPENAPASGNRGRSPWVPAAARPLTRNMLDLDPPDHTRLRGLVQKAFTPRFIEQLRTRIETLTGQLLDAARRCGAMDVIADYALPLPMTVIAEMLGIPPSDRRRFHRWSSAIVSTPPAGVRMLAAIPSVFAFLRYIRRLVARKREEASDDLTSALIRVEEAGERLTENELLAMIFLLLVAGHETTVNLIGNGVLALLDCPDQRERLRGDPSLTASAVEELLRYAGPLETATERYASEDVEVGGVRIPRGELLYAVLASANRDEAEFPNPDALDLARQPNKHLAFGLGIHYCLGAPLARLEGQIAIRALLDRAPALALAISRSSLRYRRSLVMRGLARLPVTLGL